MHEAICVQTQVLTHVSHTKPNSQYVCSVCRSQVFAVRGKRKAHHFRHKAGTPKHGSLINETEVHKFAKLYIKDAGHLKSPNGALLIFDRVELEKEIGGLRIDAVGYVGNKGYFIEVCVNNPVGRSKLEKLRQLNIDVIEIHLEHWVMNPRHLTGGREFARDVLFEAERKWLARSGWDFWKRKLTNWLAKLIIARKTQLHYDDTTGQASFDF